jgi:hypothetical protein
MGDMVGVHAESELADLTPKQRERLRKEALRQLQASPQIRAIIKKKPEMLTRNSEINGILKRKLSPLLKAFRKKPSRKTSKKK